jgi:hypothetical protein
VRRFSRYWPVPSAELISSSPLPAQKVCHDDAWAASSSAVAVVVSLPIRDCAVLIAFPPVQPGEGDDDTERAVAVRGEGHLHLGWSRTTEALTSRPPAVIAAIAPNVSPEGPFAALSTQVWASAP